MKFCPANTLNAYLDTVGKLVMVGPLPSACDIEDIDISRLHVVGGSIYMIKH